MQDLNNKVTGSQLSAPEWNEVPSELQNVITALGQSLTSADLNQLGKAIAGYVGSADFYNTGGTANALVFTPIGTIQAPPQYTLAQRVRFIAQSTNTGNMTANIAGNGVKKIRDQFDQELLPGDIVAGQRYELYFTPAFDSGNGALVYVKANATPNDLPSNYLTGYTMSNNTLTPATVLDIAAGSCKNVANNTDMFLVTTLGKSINATWTEGGNPGAPLGGFPAGLSGGVPVNNTWYRVFAIRKPNGQVDAGFDTSAIATNLLAGTAAGAFGYNTYRQIGWIYYTSAAIKKFRQYGDKFLWQQMTHDGVNIFSAAGAALTVTAPPLTLGLFQVQQDFLVNNANIYFLLSSLDEENNNPTQANHHSNGHNAGNVWANYELGYPEVMTNASSQVRHRANQDAGGTPKADVWTLGWIDTRGQ